MIVFWPLWPVLILRSPWHNSILSGAVAWAMLFVWTYLIVWEQLYKNQRLDELTIIVMIPGLLFTVITQVHWTTYKPTLARAGRKDASGPVASPTRDVDPDGHQPRPRPRRRRRRQ